MPATPQRRTAARHGRRPRLAGLAWLALCGPVCPAAAQAIAADTGAVRQSYGLAAGPLAQTLKAIAGACGCRIDFDEALVGGRQAGAVAGRFSALQAVSRALAATGLSVTQSAAGTLRIDSVSLERVLVIAKRDQAETSFKADLSETATRNGTALLDVPGSVTIITGKVLETQQASSVDDALRHVSGVVARESAQGLTGFQVRGFSQTSALLNGTAAPLAALFDVNGIERIEVLKGPQAILSGGDSLGGGLNIVSKKPQAEAVKELVLQYGSLSDRMIAVDLGGALGFGDRLSYRVIGSWAQASQSDAGFDGRQHRALMPQLRWKEADTDLIVGASIDRQHRPLNRQTFALDGIQPEPGMLLGNRHDGFDVQTKRLFYSLEHKLAPGATLVSRLQRSQDSIDQHLYAAQFPTSNTTFGMVPTNNVTDMRSLSGDHYLRFAFDTGPLSHQLSTGVNHTRQTLGRHYYAGDLQIVNAYAGTPHVFPPLTHDLLDQTDAGSSMQRGLFVQDLIELGNINLLLSLRRTRHEEGPAATTFVSRGISSTTTTPAAAMSKTTPGAGMVYKLRPDVSLYASYTRGFLPQFSTAKACSGGDFAPMETRNKELGAKVDLLAHRLSVTASVFDLTQSNRPDFLAAQQCFRQRDAIRLRGVELDVQGELATGWNLIFNYTYNRQKDAESATAVYAAQPRNAMGLWTTYELAPAGGGWGMGAGVSARGRTLSDYDATAVPIPGSAVVDASLFYQAGRWSATLGIKNLFDRTVYGYSTSPLYVPINPGRTAMLTVRTRFD